MTRTRRLGSSDIEITPIGLGCMQFAGPGLVAQFYPELDGTTITTVVRAALDSGITWFDTAEMYGGGHSERALTTALRATGTGPEDVSIATKWAPLGRTAGNIGRTIDDRIAALQGFPIALHQIHQPYGSLSSLTRQVHAMARLQQEGKIAHIGVSSFSARQMERADAVLREYGSRLVSNQVQISLLHRKIEDNGVLETARRLGVTLIAFSPLKSGLLTGKFHDSPELLGSVRPIRKVLGGFNRRTLTRTAPLIDELRKLAAAYGVTPTQVALAWLIHYYGDTVVAIPGASKPHQAVELGEAMSLRLTDAELARLGEISAH
ncbi:aldo/keto reductase [Nocardia carnea]|uniref:aldo/keto reductase n=1 Tax=Nocardia carnea TaxID=37328 RepID=UPI00245381D3|nr:aldo/keto reductase [Nocardia carnea]